MECRWWWAVGLAEYGLGRQQRAHQAKPSTGRMVVWLLGCAPLTCARSFTLAISWCAVCRLCVVEVIFKMIRITHSLSAQNLRSFLSVRPSVCPLRKKGRSSWLYVLYIPEQRKIYEWKQWNNSTKKLRTVLYEFFIFPLFYFIYLFLLCFFPFLVILWGNLWRTIRWACCLWSRAGWLNPWERVVRYFKNGRGKWGGKR